MQIKLVQLNIWNGGMLIDAALEFLQKEQPDILTLQEVYAGKDERLEKRFRTLTMLKPLLGFEHHVFVPMLIDTGNNRNIEYGNAVISRFPLRYISHQYFVEQYGQFDLDNLKIPDDVLKIAYEQLVTRAETPNGLLNIHAIHGVWGTDGEDNERRLRMSRMIVEAIKGKEKVILAGDFNVSPNTRTIDAIEEHLQNIFKDELTSTFNMRQKTHLKFSSAVVDYIFVSKDISVVDHYCPNVDISDHFPLVVVLEI